MKKFKAALPTVCYTVLLLAIALLSFLIAGKSSGATTSAKNVGSTENDKTELSEDLNIETPVETRKTYSDIFPRKGTNGQQRLYGEGNVTLCDAVQTSVGNYLFALSDCKEGDLPCAKEGLFVVRMNDGCDLLSRYSLGIGEKYVDALPSVAGMVVLSVNEEETFCFVRVLDYDLTTAKEYKIAVPNDAKIVSTEEGFFIFADYENECIMYTQSNDTLLFQTIEKGNLVELFEYAESYLLFCNRSAGESYVVRLEKKQLQIEKSQKISNAPLLGIMPIREEDKTYFLAVEQAETIVAKYYDPSTFACVRSQDVGNFTAKEILPCADGFLLLCSAPYFGYVLINQ